MIHPSYVDLMEVVNKGVEEGETPVINSRYSIVMATAKRARQIVDGDDPLVYYREGKKPLSIAVEELEQEKIHILPIDEAEVARLDSEDFAMMRSLEGDIAESVLDEDEKAMEGVDNSRSLSAEEDYG